MSWSEPTLRGHAWPEAGGDGGRGAASSGGGAPGEEIRRREEAKTGGSFGARVYAARPQDVEAADG